MGKWLAVVALGAAMAVATGCESNGNDSGDPKKMSLNSGSACSECSAHKKQAAEPKKLSAGAASECQTQCPAGKAK